MTVEEIVANIKSVAPPHRSALIAIEGYGGSGKTTFAKKLAKELGGAYVVSIDDFIIKEKLTESSWDKGCFDRSRLERQVLKPIGEGKTAKYQKLVWAGNSLSAYVEVPKARFIIVEGISSYHPDIAHYYDYKIWIDTPMVLAKERGHARDGSNENAQFWDIWEANDLRYQEKYHPELAADFIFSNQ